MPHYHNELDHVVGLAELIDADGLGAHEARVRVVARVGGPVAPVAASVLGDPREPLVARLRAFAVVTAALRSEGKRVRQQPEATIGDDVLSPPAGISRQA
ncbi:MAG: hypothetical protein ACRDWY_14195 [Actinomycetes bacterium]